MSKAKTNVNKAIIALDTLLEHCTHNEKTFEVVKCIEAMMLTLKKGYTIVKNPSS